MGATTKEQRQFHVEQTNANMRLEGIEPDADTLELQRLYVSGTVSIDDLLDYARATARQIRREEGQIIPLPPDAN